MLSSLYENLERGGGGWKIRQDSMKVINWEGGKAAQTERAV